MNKATLKITTISIAAAVWWFHYLVYKIWTPDLEAMGVSLVIIWVGIYKAYYDLKQEVEE